MDDLKHLLSAYFYDGWDEYEYGSWEAAVDDFVRRSPERVRLVLGEIDESLAIAENDADLDRRLVELGLSYSPSQGDREWLTAVRDRLRPTIEP